MNSNPKLNTATERPERRSIRLRGYDYSQVGAYFVTICTHDRACVFGNIVDGAMRLNSIGEMAAEEWIKSERVRGEIELDEWVVMPNHLHGIVWITYSIGVHLVVGATGRSPLPSGPIPRSIGAMVAGFKSAATKRINAVLGTPGAPVWQRDYYEHVIRNEDTLDRIRRYIRDNPSKWPDDPDNPVNRQRRAG